MGECQGARGRKGGGGAAVFKRGGNKLWESVALILFFFCESEATSVQCGRAGMENEVGRTPVLEGVTGLSWET